MNRFTYFLLLSLSLGIFACVGDNSASEADLKPNERSFPKNEKAILKIVSNLEENQDTMAQNGPITIIRDSVNVEVTAFIADNSPVLIKAQYPGKQEFYYLKDQKVMLLKELIFEKADSSQMVENQFFYSQSELLSMRTRSANGLEALALNDFQPLTTKGDDYRFVADKANQSAVSFIYGQ